MEWLKKTYRRIMCYKERHVYIYISTIDLTDWPGVNGIIKGDFKINFFECQHCKYVCLKGTQRVPQSYLWYVVKIFQERESESRKRKVIFEKYIKLLMEPITSMEQIQHLF